MLTHALTYSDMPKHTRSGLDMLGRTKTAAGFGGGDTKKDVTFHFGFDIIALNSVESAAAGIGPRRNTSGFPLPSFLKADKEYAGGTDGQRADGCSRRSLCWVLPVV